MFEAKVTGLPELRRQLDALKLSLRKTILQRALLIGARIYRDDAKARTPVLSKRIYIGGSKMLGGTKMPVRKPGTARRAIIARKSRSLTTASQVGVKVAVRPAKPGQAGARSPNDPYYIRWLETGTKKMRKFGMFQGAFASKTPQVLAAIVKSLAESINAFNDRKR